MERRRRNDRSREAQPVVIGDGPAGVGSNVEGLSHGSIAATDRIARRAYERFEERGGGHGRDIEDWLEAERELTNRQGNE